MLVRGRTQRAHVEIPISNSQLIKLSKKQQTMKNPYSRLVALNAAAAFCLLTDSAHAVDASDRQCLGIAIRDNTKITLNSFHPSGVIDDAYPSSNIRDTANGGQAKRSSYGTAPGGYVWLSPRMLECMQLLTKTYGYSYRVTSIAGASHSSGSYHYAGTAFDVSTINGQGVSSSNPYWSTFNQRCRNMGSIESLGPGYVGHDTHVHNAWSTSGNVAPPAGGSNCGDVAPRIDVFLRGGNNNLYQKYWNGDWSEGFSNKGGSLGGDPTAVSWGPNRIDVFARGTDSSLQHLYWDGNNWSNWENLGGGFVGNPDACSWGPGRLDIFARSSSGNLIHKWYLGSGNWSGWEDLGGPIASDPTAVSWGPGRIDVFARGLGNTLKHIYYTGSGNWSWEDKGGSLSGSPDACSYTSGRLDVFCRNSSGNLVQLYFGSGGWSSWVNLGGTLYSDPGCTSHADRRMNVFAKGGDNSLYEIYFNGTSWSGWHTMGGVLTSGPDACSWSNTAGPR
jgi:hypothetical protein